MKSNKIKVLYIAGFGRSGSTLLDRMIGQIDGFFSVGELWYIWDRGFVENQLCGCGKPFRECDFWNEVINEAFGGFGRVNIDEIKALQHYVERIRHIPQLITSLRTTRYKDKFKSYIQVLCRLYRAIHKVSGSMTIVDSSKHPSYGFVLNEIPDIEPYTIHLIRDSRAVAFSWRRKKLRPEIYWKKEYLPRQSPLKIALSWNINSVMCRRLSRQSYSSLLVRYEDLVKRPQDELKRIMRFAGADDVSELDFIMDGQIHLKEAHTVAGNPMRFKKGWIPLRHDDEWRKRISLIHHFVVTISTFPNLLRYRYIQKGLL